MVADRAIDGRSAVDERIGCSEPPSNDAGGGAPAGPFEPHWPDLCGGSRFSTAVMTQVY